MTYTITAIGGLIGTLISVIILANGHKLGFLPKDWEFFKDGITSLQRTKNNVLVFGPRIVLGGLLLPALFLYVWGPDGYLGITLFDSIIMSSMLLAMTEFSLMLIGILLGAFNQPKGSTMGLSILALISHINLGFWIGYFSTLTV